MSAESLDCRGLISWHRSVFEQRFSVAFELVSAKYPSQLR
ncbi:hypothetical protein HMPREF9278_0658 [Mobiluncus mulieris FB024-16]|nr:hypothetical protein HMPREF9278_0658 [Mobiluncus mulieris FB024-16]